MSAISLGVLLVAFQPVFGIPVKTLYFLAALPCLFAAFDFYHYNKDIKTHVFALKTIAIVNTLYCCLSIGLAFFHRGEVTAFGWGYIILEIIIVLSLAFLEWKESQRLSSFT